MTNSDKTVVIAEAGVNHNGDIEMAKGLIDAAVDAGLRAAGDGGGARLGALRSARRRARVGRTLTRLNATG